MVFFNSLNPGPNSPGNYQQPNTSAPSVNGNVASYPVGNNPLGIEQVDPYWQAGSAVFGSFDLSNARPVCPYDNTLTQVIGSSEWNFFCPTCARQYRSDGAVRQTVALPPPLIVPPNPPNAGSQWPDNRLPSVDLENVD